MENPEANPGKKPRQYIFEPLTMGDIIDRTIGIFMENAAAYLSMTAKILSPVIVLTIVMSLLEYFGKINDPTTAACISPIYLFVYLFLRLILTISTAKFTSEIYKGNKYSYTEAIKYTWMLFGAVFSAVTLVGIIMGFIFFAIVIIFAAGTFFSTIPVIGPIIMVAIGLFLIYFWGKYYFCYALVPYVVIFENLKGMDSLRRSATLFLSNSESILKIIFVPFLIQILLWLIAIIPLGNYVTIILSAIPMIAMTIIYYDIRIRAEGLDLEMEADRWEKERAKTEDYNTAGQALNK